MGLLRFQMLASFHPTLTRRMEKAFPMGQVMTWLDDGYRLAHTKYGKRTSCGHVAWAVLRIGLSGRASPELQAFAKSLLSCFWPARDPMRFRRIVFCLLAGQKAEPIADEFRLPDTRAVHNIKHRAIAYLIRGIGDRYGLVPDATGSHFVFAST